MQVEWWPIDRPKPYEKNARKIPQKAIDKVALSLRTFGWQQPISVDVHDVIVAGHTRLLAAQQEKHTKVPVVIASNLTSAQIRAYRIMDNRSHQETEWDDDILGLELGELKALDLDLAFTGFESRELDRMFGIAKPVPEAEMDRAEELLKKWKVERGQIWQIGRHRLMCGDCTSQADVAALMQGEKAGLVFTSPPYGQQRNYEKSITDWLALMKGAFDCVPAADDTQVLVNLGLIHRDGKWIPYWDGWIGWMRGQGWKRFGLYVWDQGPGLPGDWNGRLAPSHEFIFHFNRNAEKARKTKETKWGGTVNHGKGLRAANGVVSEYSDAGGLVQEFKIPDSVIRVVRHKARGIEVSHPAVFPVELPREIQGAFSDEGDMVYEPFAGSGSQFIAAEQKNRICYGLEIEPKYCAVILERMAAMGVVGELAKEAAHA